MTLYGWQYNRATSRSYRSLVVATEPTSDARPVTVAEAKEHLRIVDFTDDDDYIAGLIDAARKWCEDYCERTFADCQYTVAFDDFQAVRIELPRPPLRLNASSSEATVSIAYVDTGGTTQTLTWAESSTQDFRVDKDFVPGLAYPLYLETWPSTRIDDKAVQVTYLAGYGSVAAVPQAAKHAIKMLVSHWYTNREAVDRSGNKDVPLGVYDLLAPLAWRKYA
jgi:uncharacterized phiE125 gp8 family phage protein